MNGNTNNLKPFEPGRSGNPKGRPPKLTIDKVFDQVSEDDLKGIVSKVIAKAKAGDLRAAEFVFDRRFGKARQSMEMITEEREPEASIDYSKLSDATLREIIAATKIDEE